MNHQSIDDIQNTLANQVFSYADDRKKAAGRALGTLVELITYYTLRAWGLSENVAIERRIPEFANPDIKHNVEFSLHSVKRKHEITIAPLSLPLTPAKIKRHLPFLSEYELKRNQVISSDLVKRNATVLTEADDCLVVANIKELSEKSCVLVVCELTKFPFAIVECKRVGVEEGVRKGPQTIEKAKQGAYVAQSISSLQKIRLRNGGMQGVIEQDNGNFRLEPYPQLLRKIIDAPRSTEFPNFVLTVGVVSNHGNWFTSRSQSQNKELQILAQSYDWLLFLTDQGLSEFINQFLLKPDEKLKPVKDAFLSSYTGRRGRNKFTKVHIDAGADEILQCYFSNHESEITGWFNVISPINCKLKSLRNDLNKLSV